MKKIGLYEISVITFFVLLPIIAAIIDVFLSKSEVNALGIMFKWFVF